MLVTVNNRLIFGIKIVRDRSCHPVDILLRVNYVESKQSQFWHIWHYINAHCSHNFSLREFCLVGWFFFADA